MYIYRIIIKEEKINVVLYVETAAGSQQGHPPDPCILLAVICT